MLDLKFFFFLGGGGKEEVLLTRMLFSQMGEEMERVTQERISPSYYLSQPQM